MSRTAQRCTAKIELSRHDWETGMDEILETMTF